jgi:hypothetical protein
MCVDVEVLLRRAGLLACERSYASYTALAVIGANKANVKRATLRLRRLAVCTARFTRLKSSTPYSFKIWTRSL